jgi:hypothetical protein
MRRVGSGRGRFAPALRIAEEGSKTKRARELRDAGDESGCKPAVFVHRQFRRAAAGFIPRVSSKRLRLVPIVLLLRRPQLRLAIPYAPFFRGVDKRRQPFGVVQRDHPFIRLNAGDLDKLH